MGADLCDREHKGRSLLSYPEAVARLVLRATPAGRPVEGVTLETAEGRFLARPVILDRDEPPVRRSAMDGFAVRSRDGTAPRRIQGTVYAGTAEIPVLRPGEAVAVMTGGTVPDGADAVVPVEHTRRRSRGAEDLLEVETGPVPGANVREAGEMGRAGRMLLAAGQRLAAEDLAAAAGCGADPLVCEARPRAAVLSTGDEVVDWTAKPEAHQVRDSNRLGAVLQLARAGAEVISAASVGDRLADLEAAVAAALEQADVVVTLGGVSMGEKDLLPGVFAGLGVEELFHGVSVQPGKPVWAGTREGVFVLGLPGNPVSSFVILELFAVPLITRLSGGHPQVPRPLFRGRSGGTAVAKGRERFLPADLSTGTGGVALVTPRPAEGSGDWTCLAGARALLHLPAHAAVGEGDPVDFLPLGCV